MLLHKALVRHYLKYSINSGHPCSRRMHANWNRGCKEDYYNDQGTREFLRGNERSLQA